MRKVEAIIASVEDKIHRLGEQKRSALEELDKSRQKVQSLESRVSELNAEIDELKGKNKVIQVAQSLNSGENSTEARRRINELVREIDKCIALLNK